MQSCWSEASGPTALESVFDDGAWDLERLQHFLKSDMWSDGMGIAAFESGNAVGCVPAYCDPGRERSHACIGHTENVFVLPERRRRGVAR